MTPTLTDAVRTVADIARTHASDVDVAGRFPVEAITAARDKGLMGILVPVEHGGFGGSLPQLVQIAGTLGGACQSTAAVWVMHCQQVDALVRFASQELRDELLPHVASGNLYLGSVTTERSSGGRLLTGGSALIAENDGFQLRRDAPIVTGAAHADGFLVKVRSAPDAAPSDLSLVYVPRDQLQLETTGGWDALGMRGVENLAVTMTAPVPPAHIVGGPGRFGEIAVESFAPIAHLGWAATWLGATRRCWAELLPLLRGRTTSADPRDPLTAERMARVRGRLEVVNAYLHAVLAEVGEERRRERSLGHAAMQIHLNTLKVLAAEQCTEAARGMIELAGLDLGYRRDSPVALERLLRDLTAASLTYSDTRLLLANGALSVLDPHVRLAGGPPDTAISTKEDR
ncbi:acyl-CoA dehydrogenase [Lentzea albidocapillata subsp. violacea]|uniref:Acyl-CoA dehydrogenase n=1 Tax=Lentzea albidocapillata subsp. violacea TaxID=128104 RepID=A0A1G9XUM1_9PSEU|nr:acyl-CoA dehydrogenase family protein [Lentzea albidocapillata]SDM99933.1 acyl-CoA dehydrogenase [Lentzea albidocapillata subsp. violacea]